MSSSKNDKSKQSQELSPIKQVLLEKMLKGRASDTADYQFSIVIPNPKCAYDPFPLTDMQQAYWVGRSGVFEIGAVSSHVYLEIESTHLDLPRFTRAWQRLVERHEMLRAIVSPDGRQRVLEHVPPYEIDIVNLVEKDEQAAEAEVRAIRERMSHQVLASDRWPLFEVRATRLRGGRTRFHMSIDTLFCDGWSLQLLLSKLSQLYQNDEVVLPPLELTFRDYVLEVAKLQNSNLFKRSQQYWEARLSTLPAAPELPLTQNPKLIMRPRFERRSGKLNSASWFSLKSKAARLGLTPSGIILASFADVLGRWSKSQCFTINLTLFNRLPLHPQVNEIIGDFTSVTLLAVDNSSAGTFTMRALRIKEQLWHDLDHHYFSGVKVLRELNKIEKRFSGSSMPVVLTSALLSGGAIQDDAGLVTLGEIVYSITQTPQVWLDHQVFERGGELVFNWDAVEELFPAGMLDDMFSAYCQLLRRLADEEQLWEAPTLDLLPAAQMEQRSRMNATEEEIPRGLLLQTFFEERAAGHPEEPAIIPLRRSISYGELSQLRNRVAHRLRQLGAEGADKLVGVVMEKGWEQVVAVLGVLTAGAAYLPIDAGLPAERLAYLLSDGKVEVVLTQTWLEEALEWPDGVRRLSIDDDGQWRPYPETGLRSVRGERDLAYVIYTSGSTGAPKGVMIEHRAAVNTIVDVNRRFGVNSQDRVLAVSSLSFDLSVYDI